MMWGGSLSEISSVRGEGWHCESEGANHIAVSGGAGATGNCKQLPSTAGRCKEVS